LRGHACLLKHATEGRIEGMGRRGRRRRKQLLDNIEEKRRYGNLKREKLDSTVRKIRFGWGYGPVAKQTTNFTYY
jgi:hypothetical protein